MTLLIYGFWLVLNGRLTGEILALGVPVTVLTVLFLCALRLVLEKEAGLYRCVPGLVAYCGVLVWEIVKANLALVRVVYRGTPSPVVRTVHTGLKSRLARTLLANSITLTPGTITLSCREDEIVVHCLTPEMASGLDSTVFEKRLLKLEEALHG